MSRLGRLLVITIVESFATILIERGVYFFTHERLGFSDTQNLWLALGFGVAYATGALSSHNLARRLSEKGLLLAALGAQLAGLVGLCAWQGAAAVAVGNTVIGFFTGLKWPVVESYVASGQTPREQARMVGRFNLAWAAPTAVAVAASGPLIAWCSPGLFLAAAALNVVSLALVVPLERRPTHLAVDHPERPDAEAMTRYGGLLASARWSMLSKYSLMWILAALVPGVFMRLGVGLALATVMSGLLDVVRCLTFLVLGLYVGWHNRRGPLVWSIVGLPAGFFMALFAPNLAVLLAGEVVFGVAAGMTYYAALYYAMVVKNASVEAGGGHEGLIGTGFAVGPVAGLAGHALAPVLGGLVPGMLVGSGAIILTGAVGAAVALARTRRRASGAA